MESIDDYALITGPLPTAFANLKFQVPADGRCFACAIILNTTLVPVWPEVP
jgi:hypothetical protein